VITPGGVEIWFNMDWDAESQGRLDHDDVPDRTDRFLENIFFPTDGSAPKGSYQYFVHNYNQVGDETDNWTLAVYLGEERLRFHSGKIPDNSTSPIYDFYFN
jgi:hypothetical protein